MSAGINTSANSYAEPASGSLVSMAKLVLWLLQEWLRQFIGKYNLTLRLCEGYYHDLPIDPTGYRYGGPRWFARLVGKLFPSPDLWILLDQDTEGLQSRNQGAPLTEAHRQLQAYRAFVKTRKRYVILDASKPVASVTEEAYAAIINTLAQLTDSKLKDRF